MNWACLLAPLYMKDVTCNSFGCVLIEIVHGVKYMSKQRGDFNVVRNMLKQEISCFIITYLWV